MHVTYLAVDFALPPVKVALAIADFHFGARKLSVSTIEFDLRRFRNRFLKQSYTSI